MMKLEIVHDLLAKSVFDTASADDKARARAETIIKTRFVYYQTDETLLLGEGELNYIQPYLKELLLTNEEEEFVAHSKKVMDRQRNLLRSRNYIIAIMALVMVLMPFGVVGWYNAYTESQKAKEATQEKVKTQDSLQFAQQEVNVLRKAVIGEVAKDELAAVMEQQELSNLNLKELKPIFTPIRILGEVKAPKGKPLSDASVELLGTSIETNRYGAFDVYVFMPPYYMQQDSLALKITSKGYTDFIYKFKPKPEIKEKFELEPMDNRLNKNVNIKNIKIK